jgi:hypothetical protein
MNERKPIPLGTAPYEKGYVAGRAAYDEAKALTADAVSILHAVCCDKIPMEFQGSQNEREYEEGFYAAVVDRLAKEAK